MSLSACQTSAPKRIDGDDPENVTIGFGRTDIQEIVETAFKKFSAANPQSDWSPKAKPNPYVCVGKVSNQTDEHVDTKNVTDMLRSRLQESSLLRFTTDQDKRKGMLREVDEQEESGLYKGDKAAKKGNWIPPEYILDGRFSSIRKKNDSVEDVYYAFVLKLTDINSGVIVWESITQIAKEKTKAGVGW
jgi:penicillin-binding protein activator